MDIKHGDAVASARSAGTELVALDTLRWVAALLVLLEHGRTATFLAYGDLPQAQQTLVAKGFYLLTRLGGEAVMLFFVLSGFLVGGQVIRRVREGRFSVKSYAIDRVARILPPLVPAVLLAAAVGAIWFTDGPGIWDIVATLGGFNGVLVSLNYNPPLWSLTYEIWFYIFAGAAAAIITGKGGLPALLVMLVAMMVFLKLDASLMLPWLAGACAAPVQIQRGRGILALLGGLLIVGGTAVLQLSRASQALPGMDASYHSLGMGVFVSGFVLALPWLSSASLNRTLVRVPGLAVFSALFAGMSYTLYLMHYPLLVALQQFSALQDFTLSGFGLYLGMLAASLALTVATYWVFERNTGVLRTKLKALLGAV